MLQAALILGQDVRWADLAVVGLLVLLEGVLSIDNALVLGLLAKRLPRSQQSSALTYGLVGAFVFRIGAIGTASLLMQWRVVKLVGGGYLVYIAIRHLFFEARETREGDVTIGPEGEPALVDAATGGPLSPQQESIEIEERVPIPLPEEFTAMEVTGTRARFWPTR